MRAGSPVFAILLAALNGLIPLSIDASLPALPAMARALSASSVWMQATVGGFLFAYAFGQLVLGPLADRFGRRVVLLCGLGLYVVAGLVCSAAPNAAVLIVARIAQGLGASAGPLTTRAMIRDLFEDRQRAAAMQAYVASMQSIAPVVAPLVGAGLMVLWGWRGIYAGLTAAGAVLTAVVWTALAETRKTTSTQPSERSLPAAAFAAYGRYLRLPRSVFTAIIVAATFGGQFAFISNSPFVLIDEFGVSRGLYAVAFAVASAGFIVGSVAAARFARAGVRIERILTLGTAALAVTAVAGLLVDLAAHPSALGFVVFMAAYSAAAGMITPAAYAAGMEFAGAMAGVASAVLGAAQTFGGSIGSTLVGLAGGHASFAVAINALSAAVIVVIAERFAQARRPKASLLNRAA